MPNPLILHAPARGDGLALPLGLAGYPTEIEGKPVHFRRKEVIRAGKWTHRGTRQPFEIDRARMDTWVATFNRRLANGIKPYVPDHHTEEPKAGENFGHVVGLHRDGDSLYADLELIGDDALSLAAKNDVSVYVKAEGIDAHGNAYGEHLHHLALTPNPNQPNLGPFVTVAASAASPAVEAPVFELGAQGDPPMDLKKLRTALGLADDVPDEQVIEKAAERATAATADAAQVTALSADVTRLNGELATAKSEAQSATLALSAAAPKEYDPLALTLIGESFQTKRAQAIASGAISENGMNALDAILLPNGKPSPIALSLSAGSTRPLYAQVCEIIAGNPGVKLNNQVDRAKPIALSAGTSDDEEMTPERRAYVAQCLGVSPDPVAKSA